MEKKKREIIVSLRLFGNRRGNANEIFLTAAATTSTTATTTSSTTASTTSKATKPTAMPKMTGAA